MAETASRRPDLELDVAVAVDVLVEIDRARGALEKAIVDDACGVERRRLYDRYLETLARKKELGL